MQRREVSKKRLTIAFFASAIVKSVNVLMAIGWIKKAWKEVTIKTIINCFKVTVAFPQDQKDGIYLFAALDEVDKYVEELVQQINSEVTADEYMSADDGLSTMSDF